MYVYKRESLNEENYFDLTKTFESRIFVYNYVKKIHNKQKFI